MLAHVALSPTLAEKVVPRSLILTDDQLLLCEEDVCVELNTPGKPPVPQFVKESAHPLSDVTSVDLDNAAPLGLRIMFEREGEAVQSEPWELVCQSPLEKERLLKHLKAAWRSIFKLDLTINERGPAQWPQRQGSVSKGGKR